MSPGAGRMYAARWFARAASMACALILAVFVVNDPSGSVPEFLLSALVILVAPVLVAGFWGATLGAAILEPSKTRSKGRAALVGLAVSGASFVSYLFILSFCMAAFGSDRAGDFFKVFILLLVFGTILCGWLVGITGAYAGALLYKKVGGERVPPAYQVRP